LRLRIARRGGGAGLGQLDGPGDRALELRIQLRGRLFHVDSRSGEAAEIVVDGDGAALKQDQQPDRRCERAVVARVVWIGGNCLPQDSMVCKRRGPIIVPFGPWVETVPTIPAANVSGGPIDVIVVEGQQATDSFALANTGDPGSSLDYTVDTATTSCATPVAVAWLARLTLSSLLSVRR
jgi:hypothetical protein